MSMAEVKRAYGNRYRLESMYCDMCDVTHLKNIFNFLYKKKQVHLSIQRYTT